MVQVSRFLMRKSPSHPGLRSSRTLLVETLMETTEARTQKRRKHNKTKQKHPHASQKNPHTHKTTQKDKKKNDTGALWLGKLHRSGENHTVVHSTFLYFTKLIFNAGM